MTAQACVAVVAAGSAVLWYALPLAVVVSLVYSASRYEMPQVVLHRATRLCLTIVACMVAIFVLLYLLSAGLQATVIPRLAVSPCAAWALAARPPVV